MVDGIVFSAANALSSSHTPVGEKGLLTRTSVRTLLCSDCIVSSWAASNPSFLRTKVNRRPRAVGLIVTPSYQSRASEARFDSRSRIGEYASGSQVPFSIETRWVFEKRSTYDLKRRGSSLPRSRQSLCRSAAAIGTSLKSKYRRVRL